MKINIKKILELFDGEVKSRKGDISSIIALLGEDLNAGVFRYYLKTKGKRVEILESTPVQGIKKGKWLDRWIVNETDKIIYQCEIKSWASTAIGGKTLPINASKKQLSEVSLYHQERQKISSFDHSSKHPNSVSKVFFRMKKPETYKDYKIEPLVIYWMPISFDKNDLTTPFSTIKLKGKIGDFDHCTIFSVSLYLRKIKVNYLNLDLNNFERRLELLNNFN